MFDQTRNGLGVVLLVVALVASVAAGGAVALQQTAEPATQSTAYLRVAHASPDAPAVDVLVDNESVLTNVSFGEVSDYLTLEAGSYAVTITAAGDRETVVFDDEVEFEPRTVTTLAATGEVSEDANTTFEPVLYADDAFTPAEDEAAARIIHLSPDAPTVDVTVDNGSEVIADNVSFGEAVDYQTVSAGNHTVEVRAATETDDGPVVFTVNVSLESGAVYTGLAVGYLEPGEAPAETPFDAVLTRDASATISLPDEAAAENESMT